jgi:hypothetical protein
VVHQDLAHKARSHSEEMRTVLPAWAALVNEAQVRLVDERAWPQHVGHSFSAEMAGSKPAELSVDDRHELSESLLVTVRPFSQ